MKDRKGNPIQTIYRSKNSLKPARENVNRSRENARRLRQMERNRRNAPARERGDSVVAEDGQSSSL